MQKPGSLLKGGRRALYTISGSTFRRKRKIRTLLLLEKGSDFVLVVHLQGLEPWAH